MKNPKSIIILFQIDSKRKSFLGALKDQDRPGILKIPLSADLKLFLRGSSFSFGLVNDFDKIIISAILHPQILHKGSIGNISIKK
jgi:hypothetical protein